MDYELLEEQVTFLGVKDEETGALLAYDCESKGPTDAWVVRQFVRDVEDLGRKDICFMADEEPATIAKQSAIATARRDRTVPRNSPPYNPQSNGGAEKAVQDINDMARRHLLGLEARLRCKIPLQSNIVSWMIRHARMQTVPADA